MTDPAQISNEPIIMDENGHIYILYDFGWKELGSAHYWPSLRTLNQERGKLYWLVKGPQVNKEDYARDHNDAKDEQRNKK